MDVRFRGSWIFVSMFFCLSSIAAAPASAADIPDWVYLLNAQFYQAYNGRDLEGLGNYYAPDATVDDWRGLDAIKAGIKKEWESDLICSGMFTRVKVVGDSAAGWGHDVCWTKGGSVSETNGGDWLTLFQKQPNGEWRAVFEHWEE